MIKNYPFPQKRWVAPVLGIYLFFLAWLSRDSQGGLYLLSFYKAQFLSCLLSCLVGLAWLGCNRKNWGQILKDGRGILTLAFCLTLLIPVLARRDWQMMYISILYCILVAMLLSYFTNVRELSRVFVAMMAVLSLVSLVCTYVLRIPADRGVLVPPVFQNSFQAEFYNYFLCFVSRTFAKERNFGIFREPGVYQFFLFLALYLNNYYLNWRRESHMWMVNALLVVTMLSTFASGGVAVTAVFLVALYFDKKVYKTKPGKIFTAVFLAMATVAGLWLVIRKPPLYVQLKLMVLKFFIPNPSLDDRVESIRFNLHALSFRPFLGREISYLLEMVAHNTSSTTLLLGCQGIVFGWLNLVGWLVLVLRGKGSLVMKGVSFLMLAATFNCENLVTNPYLWIFSLLALTEALLPKLYKLLYKKD